jgi:anti-sigma factor RsiW
MNTCSRFEVLINRHVDHDLSDAEAATLHAHLGRCPECRARLRSLLLLREDFRAVRPPSVPRSLDRRVASIALAPPRQMLGSSFAALFMKTVPVPLPAAALFLIALLTAGFFLWRTAPTERRAASPNEQTVMVLLPTVDVYAQQQTSQTGNHD